MCKNAEGLSKEKKNKTWILKTLTPINHFMYVTKVLKQRLVVLKKKKKEMVMLSIFPVLKIVII